VEHQCNTTIAKKKEETKALSKRLPEEAKRRKISLFAWWGEIRAFRLFRFFC